MKKIVYLHQTGKIGGSGLGLYYTAKVLKERFNLVIYCPENPMDMANFMREKGFNVKTYCVAPGYFNYYSGGPKLISRSFFSSICQIWKGKEYWKMLFSSEKADLIIVNSMVLSWMSRIIRESGAKSLCYVRETLPKDVILIRNKIMKIFLNSFDGVLFISEYDMKRMNLDKPICEIVRDSIDDSEFKCKVLNNQNLLKLEDENKELNLLFVGGGDRIKGLDIAIKAMNMLKDLDIHLLIAGYCDIIDISGLSIIKKIILIRRNRYLNNIYRIINKNNLGENIKFIGVQKDMSEIYNKCDVLLFPSTKPHQARPVFEAGFFGKPAIISDYPQTNEHITHEYNGLCFTPKNHKKLANSIKRLYNDRSLVAKYGKNNNDLANKKHNFKHISNVLNNFIDVLLNSCDSNI